MIKDFSFKKYFFKYSDLSRLSIYVFDNQCLVYFKSTVKLYFKPYVKKK
jgi:hypothetical protein